MDDDLPSSGEPGLSPPRPGSLPRPALWSAGTGDTPFRGAQEDTADPPAPGRRKVAAFAILIMVVGVVLLGVAVATLSWPAALAGVVVGSAGAVLGVRVRIMEDVSVSDSPHGPA